MTKIAITGHQNIFETDHEVIQSRLLDKISSLKNAYHNVSFIVGQAEGVDKIAIKVLDGLGLQYILLKAYAKNENQGSTPFYEAQANELVSKSDHIIAVWDGLFSYKKGGTSDIVQKAMDADRPIQIHHLITPRKENPYPIHSLNEEVIDFQNGKFNRVPFAINFSWISFKNEAHSLKKDENKKGWLFFDRELFWKFIFPIILVLTTLIIGFIGFQICENHKGPIDNLFNAANLLTLNSSALGYDVDFICFINIARFLGLFFLIYAFVYGFYLALGDKRALLKLRRWKQKENFNIVIGLNLESKYLINDLTENHDQYVVLLYQGDKNSLLGELKSNSKVIAIKGNLTSRRALTKLFPNEAKNIYIMSSQDDINLRASQELDAIRSIKNNTNRVDQFVRIKNSFKRKFLHDTLSNHSAARSNIFNFNTNIVRRLLLLFPVDRFHQTPNANKAQVVILGFNSLGEELLLTVLKQGHYTTDKHLEVDVICEQAKKCKKAFLEKYPTLKSIYNEDKKIIEKYTWDNIKLQFHERENSPQYWLDEANPIYKNIDKESILTIYSTADDAVQSAAFINIFLPKLNNLKHNLCNLQLFIHYNLPDKKETEIIEQYFNKLAPRIPVKCFGNYTDECKQNSVQNMALDALPKIINASYSNIDIEDTDQVNYAWNTCNEKNKDSSRQAADHLWVKLRVLWPNIDSQFDPNTFEPSASLSELINTEEFKEAFSEFEHRRWCAELLLRGYNPITEDINSKEYKDISKEWALSSFKPEKNKYLQLFQHIDLVPYKDLHKDEAAKDLNQLTNISTYLRALIRKG